MIDERDLRCHDNGLLKPLHIREPWELRELKMETGLYVSVGGGCCMLYVSVGGGLPEGV
jgi:hypothetical protein